MMCTCPYYLNGIGQNRTLSDGCKTRGYSDISLALPSQVLLKVPIQFTFVLIQSIQGRGCE